MLLPLTLNWSNLFRGGIGARPTLTYPGDSTDHQWMPYPPYRRYTPRHAVPNGDKAAVADWMAKVIDSVELTTAQLPQRSMARDDRRLQPRAPAAPEQHVGHQLDDGEQASGLLEQRHSRQARLELSRLASDE